MSASDAAAAVTKVFCVEYLGNYSTAQLQNTPPRHQVALDGLYSLTGNDVISYFWSARQQVEQRCWFLGHFPVAMSRYRFN